MISECFASKLAGRVQAAEPKRTHSVQILLAFAKLADVDLVLEGPQQLQCTAKFWLSTPRSLLRCSVWLKDSSKTQVAGLKCRYQETHTRTSAQLYITYTMGAQSGLPVILRYQELRMQRRWQGLHTI